MVETSIEYLDKQKIKPGDLCLYRETPVIVLEKFDRSILTYNSKGEIIEEPHYSWLCLFCNTGIDTLTESSLRKLQ